MSWLEALSNRYRGNVNPVKTERTIELLVLVAALILCLMLLYGVVRVTSVSIPPAVVPAADVLQALDIQARGIVSNEQSRDIRARPLFWPSRRPVEEVPVVAAPEPAEEKAEELKGVRLMGLFGSGETAGLIALVKGKKQRILQGESLLGWTLESVDSNRVVLVDGPRRKELELVAGKVVASADSGLESAEAGAEVGPTEGGSSESGSEVKKPSPPAGLSFGNSSK